MNTYKLVARKKIIDVDTGTRMSDEKLLACDGYKEYSFRADGDQLSIIKQNEIIDAFIRENPDFEGADFCIKKAD